MMAGDWSIFTEMERCRKRYSESEFKEQLKEVDLSSKKCKRGRVSGWVFWSSSEVFEQPLECESDNIIINPQVFSSNSEGEIKEKMKRFLEKMISWGIMVQFWAALEVDEQQQKHVYLTTAHQPFAVEALQKGFCLYRQHCMSHRYRVDEGAEEKELGAVGRVYRSKRPESSPDLRLYSTTEFPLRDVAARCGLRTYLALPVFDDLLKEKCYGVIEVLNFRDDGIFCRLERALKTAKLGTTHINIASRTAAITDVDSEITEMLELAIRAVPQLQMTQVWVPCHECSNTSNNLSCMESATFIHAGDERVNSNADKYDQACELHNLQIGKHRNMIAAVMSSNNKSCICRNICEFSISENPLAHYAQKARLSFCFAICVQRIDNRRKIYVVEFFLQCNSTKDASVESFLSLLLRIMDMKLEKYAFPYKRRHEEEIVVPSFGESSQFNALQYESIKYKLQHLEEVMERCEDEIGISDFTKYLEKAGLHYAKYSDEITEGWTFWSQAREESSENEINSNSSPWLDAMQKKIKCLMSAIPPSLLDKYALAQFWAPKMNGDRYCLGTSNQPFALRNLHKGLAFFRNKCMEHHYFVDEVAKEEELGPPGRVFRNGHPEITPDLRFYSPTEFPLRNDAAHCCLRKYFALPVFDLNQNKCVGVLELVGWNYTSLAIQIALKKANLSSPHIQWRDIPGNLALTEIEEARELFNRIPQLYKAKVWVADSKCPASNNKLSFTQCVRDTAHDDKLDWPMYEINIEPGKGIIGMALRSENMSCLCRNLCVFGIADEPRAHYAQQDRLDICFAICMQSRHTGDLLYVLEFYLNQGPWKYEYLRSFMCFLLPIMEQKLKSFKVASGQQLGEKLVVEVIEFSEVDELDFSELDQPDAHPVTFRFVNYGSQRHSKDKQVQSAPEVMESVRIDAQQSAPEVMESVRIDAQPEHTSISTANLNKNNAAKETMEGKTEIRLSISLKDLESQYGKKRKEAAEALDISLSTFKRRCRECGIKRWPENEGHKKNPSLFMTESANGSAGDSQQNMGLPSCSNPPPSDMPLQQNSPHADPKSSQGLIVQPKDDMVIIYAKYENKTIKFKLCHSAGMEKLENEVATRLKLDVGSFELEYLDEANEKIFLTCDADLELCLESLAAVGKIQMFIKSI